jgi:GAF domain-containing protein
MANGRVAPRTRRWSSGLLAGAALVAAVSGLVALLEPLVPDLVGLPSLYLLAVLPVAIRWGVGPGVAVAVASSAAFAFLFVPPRMTFQVNDSRYLISMGIFLVSAVLVGQLAARSQRGTQQSARLSREQAALRQVATLVASGAQPQEVFDAVNGEIARLLQPDATTLVRFEPDDSGTFLAGSGWRGRGVTVGRAMGMPASLAPLRSGEVIRLDDLAQRPDMSYLLKKLELVAIVACPIVVEGRVWGWFGVGSRAGPFPAETEQRLVGFTELIGTAIANAESRAENTRLLELQAALRDVATLVARGAAPEDVFAAVTDEIGRVLHADAAIMLRLDPDGITTVLAEFGHHPSEVPVGSQWELAPELAMAEVLRTGRPARRDDYRAIPGAFADVIRGMGIRSSVAIPIIVEGRIWGALGVGTTKERFPPDTERQLESFIELVSTAIGNARYRAEINRLAGEQAALRRLATLVAHGAPPQEVFAAVTVEVAEVLDVDVTTLVRWESEQTVTYLGGGGWRSERWRVGDRSDVLAIFADALQSGNTVRLDDLGRGSETADGLRDEGIVGFVACPVTVEGRVWGAFGVGSRTGPLPAETEHRLVDFAELVGTAIANAESRAEITRLLELQAALHRVATLVAREAEPDEVVPAVAEEIGRVLGAEATIMIRCDPDGAGTIVAQHGPHPRSMLVGERWTFHPNTAMSEALRTGRPAVRDGYADHPLDETTGEIIRTMGVRHTISVPILVEGRIWGALGVSRTRAERFPPDTLQRMASFAELLSTAVRNAENRAETRRLLDEQAALRRVATVVAHGAPPREVFASVADEVIRLLDVDVAMLFRIHGETATFVSISGWEGGPVGGTARVNKALRELLEEQGVFRVDDVTEVPEAVDAFQGSGVRAIVGYATTVEGRLWGTFVVGSRSGPLPAATEQRLTSYAELIATAIANAESRAEITQLMEHQAALRRVATLVAREAAPDEVIPAVADEIGRVLGAEAMHMLRLEPDGGPIIVAQKGDHPPEMGVGKRYQLDPGLAMTEAVRTGRPARRDHYENLEGTFAGILINRMGLRSGVAIPILVEGRIWGTLGIATSRGPFPAHTEQRLASFTELIALAIANADSRSQTLQLLEEQAALRRVATLVATGPSPTEVSRVVADEVRRLLGVEDAGVCRYEPDGTGVLVVGLGPNIRKSAPRWALEDAASTSQVWRTGRSARFDADRWANADGPIADQLRRLSVRSVAASPIVVEGRLWGAVVVWSKNAPLPPDTEERMASFTELVAMAIGNAESRAELAASRARIVAASDETRRRIERDLHDGAQQRLVSLGLELRLAQTGVPEELREVRGEIARIADELASVLDELREMARGIHPAMLSEGGLRPALRTLARRATLPVELDIATDQRFPQPVEVAAYYVVSEALTNAAKHSDASYVGVSVSERDGVLHLSIGDDGVGGADPLGGSGLIGLRDRVEALGGTIGIKSPPGTGTTVQVTLPL